MKQTTIECAQSSLLLHPCRRLQGSLLSKEKSKSHVLLIHLKKWFKENIGDLKDRPSQMELCNCKFSWFWNIIWTIYEILFVMLEILQTAKRLAACQRSLKTQNWGFKLSRPKIWRKSEQNCDRESAPIESSNNGRHDVIKFKFSKMEKNVLSKCKVGNLWKVKSKSVHPSGL